MAPQAADRRPARPGRPGVRAPVRGPGHRDDRPGPRRPAAGRFRHLAARRTLRRHRPTWTRGRFALRPADGPRQRGHRLQFRGPGGGGYRVTSSLRVRIRLALRGLCRKPSAAAATRVRFQVRAGPPRWIPVPGVACSLMRPHRSSAVSPARAESGLDAGRAGCGFRLVPREIGGPPPWFRVVVIPQSQGQRGRGSLRGRSSAGRGRSRGAPPPGQRGVVTGPRAWRIAIEGPQVRRGITGRLGLGVPASRKGTIRGGTGTRRRIVPGWRRKGRAGTGTGPGRKGATGGGGTSSPKRRTMPWRRTGTGPGRKPAGRTSSPKRLPVPWRRNKAAGVATPGRPSRRHPVRRARWQRQHAGKPQRFKAARFRVRRVRARAARNWRAARGHAGGSFPRPAGMNALRRRWRIRQGKTVPGGWTRNEQRRLARRRALMRLPRHSASGSRNRLARPPRSAVTGPRPGPWPRGEEAPRRAARC